MGYCNQEVFFKKETTWGTGVDPTTPTTLLTEVLGITKDATYKVENSNNVYNNASSSKPLYKTIGNASLVGSYSFDYVNAMPFVLMLGDVAAGVEEEAPYTWTITPTECPSSFSASYYAKGTNLITTQLVGCYPTSLDFRLSTQGVASGTLNFIAKNKNDTAFTAPTTIALPSTDPIESVTTTIDIGDLTSIAYVTGIDFSISRSSKIGYSLSSRVGTQNISGKYGGVTGTINAWVEDSATAREIEDLVLGDTGTIGTPVAKDIVVNCKGGTGADSIVIKLKDALFKGADVKFPLNDGLTYSFPFTATYVSSVVWEAPVACTVGGWYTEPGE